MIKVKKMSKYFNNIKILDNIDFEINKGERKVIIGPSGSRKDYFFKMLRVIRRNDNWRNIL